MIEIKDLKKAYKMGDITVQALAGVSLKIETGDFVAIMGPSGSGKSTLMHVLGLLDAPDAGSYLFSGQEVSGLSEDAMAALRLRTIGFVFQQFNLLAKTEAIDNVMLPRMYCSDKGSEEDAKKLLERVGLGNRLNHMPSELSGGQQQRVAIARALVNNPAVLFADEPTGNLDSESTAEIMKLFTELNQSGITIILVTHEQEIANHARRIIRMRDGKVQSDERTDRIEQSSKPVQQPLSDENPSRWTHTLGKLQLYIVQGTTALLAHKIRSGLSMLGILIGVAAVVAMLAIGTGAKRSIEDQLSSMGSNLLVLSAGARRSFGVSMEPGAVTRFTLEDSEDIQKSIPEIKRVVPAVNGKARLVFGNKNWSTAIKGTTLLYGDVRNSPAVLGRYFSDEEDSKRERVAVIGLTIVRELFGDRNPIGETLKINKTGFQVIGVMKERGSNGPNDLDDIVVVPLRTAMYRLLGKNYLDSIDIEVTNSMELENVEGQVRDLIIRRHRLPESQEDSFTIRNMAEMQEALSSTSKAMSMLLACIAAISLLVGGIGIMNIMLVSVSERTREIGLRKAIGAKQIDILSQFLVEAIIVSVSGGIMGLILGILISLAVSSLAGWATYISIGSVTAAFGFSASIGIVFGLWPAKKASQLRPIVALRHE